MALILLYVIFYIPLVQLHLQLRIQDSSEGFQFWPAVWKVLLAIPLQDTREGVHPWHVVAKLPLRATNDVLQGDSIKLSLYDVASPLVYYKEESPEQRACEDGKHLLLPPCSSWAATTKICQAFF